MNKKTSVIKCKQCNKYYDYNNVNFFLNLAISKNIQEKKHQKAILKLKTTLKNKNDFEWCYCYSEEKIKYKQKAQDYLEQFENQYKNFNKTDIKNIGLDFFSNTNHIYIKNGQNFNNVDFFSFLKITKNQLEYEEDFSFDFLTYDKLKSEEFKKSYQSYFTYPNYLLIDEIELLNGKNSQYDSIILKNILTIIKERISNEKIIFIVLNKKIKDFKEIMLNNFWDTEENVIINLIKMLENKDNFELKDIILKKTKKGLVIHSKKLQNIIKKTKIKKEIVEEPIINFEN